MVTVGGPSPVRSPQPWDETLTQRMGHNDPDQSAPEPGGHLLDPRVTGLQ